MIELIVFQTSTAAPLAASAGTMIFCTLRSKSDKHTPGGHFWYYTFYSPSGKILGVPLAATFGITFSLLLESQLRTLYNFMNRVN